VAAGGCHGCTYYWACNFLWYGHDRRLAVEKMIEEFKNHAIKYEEGAYSGYEFVCALSSVLDDIDFRDSDSLTKLANLLTENGAAERTKNLEEALKATMVVINGCEFSERGGSEVTEWGICPECGGADWKGHREDCTILKVMSQAREALK